jgi:phosphoglycerate dehydrogenase-like enzyme
MILTHEDVFGKEEWEAAGKPMKIATASTGTDHIDVEYLEAQGVTVHCLLDDREALEEIRASSEFTFMAILMGLRRVHRLLGAHDRREPRFELYKKKVGIVGMGRNGSNIKRWCEAFGAEVQFNDPYVNEFPQVGRPILFRDSDVVVITCSLTEETRHMIDMDLFKLMKENAVFVNTSRGAVVNEEDLHRILLARPDITAVIDVLEGENENSHTASPLWWCPNAIVTPHIAGHTVESERKAHAIAEKLLYTHS